MNIGMLSRSKNVSPCHAPKLELTRCWACNAHTCRMPCMDLGFLLEPMPSGELNSDSSTNLCLLGVGIGLPYLSLLFLGLSYILSLGCHVWTWNLFWKNFLDQFWWFFRYIRKQHLDHKLCGLVPVRPRLKMGIYKLKQFFPLHLEQEREKKLPNKKFSHWS